jgi:hypothetical protein
MRRLLIVCIFLLGAVVARAQDSSEFSARLETTNTEPLLGEPFEMTLIVRLPTGYELVVPQLPPDWGDFGILTMGEPSVQEQGAARVFSLEMTVAAWQVGEIETPQTVVEYRAVDGSETGNVPVEPLMLRVPSTLDENPTLRISRLTIPLPFSRAMLIAAGAAVMSVVVVGGAFMLQRYQQRRAAAMLRGRMSPRSLAEQTIQTLNRIRTESPDIIVQYAAMGDTLREYIEQLCGFATHDLTTTELMDELDRRESLPRGRQKELKFLLEQADLAKFAPAKVYAPKDMSILQMAMSWVQSVEREVTS